MKKGKIREIINKCIGKYLSKPVNKIKNDENLFTLGEDSMNFIKVVVQIEDELGIEFQDYEIGKQNWTTIDNIYKLVEKKENEIHR